MYDEGSGRAWDALIGKSASNKPQPMKWAVPYKEDLKKNENLFRANPENTKLT
jgi:hypothetical protein